MGEIINVTTGDELPEPLTETEASGFRSGEYLADGPAIDAVEDDETVEFVATNRKQGIALRSETTEHVIPDDRYRTIVVVTDRRVIALVGMTDGDREFTLDICEITDVGTTMGSRTGRLTIDRADGPSWQVHTEASELEAMAKYLHENSEACGSASKLRATTQSIRGLFETTVDTAKSFERDRVAEVMPALKESPLGTTDDDSGGTAEMVTQAQVSTAGPESDATADPESDATADDDRMDTETAIDEIATSLAKTEWSARGAPPESPFDLFAEREKELMGIVVHCPDDGVIGKDPIKQCDAITGAAGTDTVMLATTGTVRGHDARLAAELGVRLRNVETLCDTLIPPTIEAVAEMVGNVLERTGWSVRPEAAGPFDLLADHGDELMGVVIHSPEDGTVESSIEHCHAVTGAAGTDTVMLATTGTVSESDERLAEKRGVRLVTSESLSQRHVTRIARN